jgi:hypothetical protein
MLFAPDWRVGVNEAEERAMGFRAVGLENGQTPAKP